MSNQQSTTTNRKGLIVYVVSYEHSNVTEFTKLTLVGSGIPEIFPITPERPGVEIVPHRAGAQYPEVAVLVDGADSPAAFLAKAFNGAGSRTWSMASGTWIHSSDSRFPYNHPVALHNRYEVNA